MGLYWGTAKHHNICVWLRSNINIQFQSLYRYNKKQPIKTDKCSDKWIIVIARFFVKSTRCTWIHMRLYVNANVYLILCLAHVHSGSSVQCISLILYPKAGLIRTCFCSVWSEARTHTAPVSDSHVLFPTHFIVIYSVNNINSPHVWYHKK